MHLSRTPGKAHINFSVQLDYLFSWYKLTFDIWQIEKLLEQKYAPISQSSAKSSTQKEKKKY